jgi:hypothetical protein
VNPDPVVSARRVGPIVKDLAYIGDGSARPDEWLTTACSGRHVKDMMSLLGQFLLEIRRSTGNESTKLDKWDMLEWFLKDAREFQSS